MYLLIYLCALNAAIKCTCLKYLSMAANIVIMQDACLHCSSDHRCMKNQGSGSQNFCKSCTVVVGCTCSVVSSHPPPSNQLSSTGTLGSSPLPSQGLAGRTTERRVWLLAFFQRFVSHATGPAIHTYGGSASRRILPIAYSEGSHWGPPSG